MKMLPGVIAKSPTFGSDYNPAKRSLRLTPTHNSKRAPPHAHSCADFFLEVQLKTVQACSFLRIHQGVPPLRAVKVFVGL